MRSAPRPSVTVCSTASLVATRTRRHFGAGVAGRLDVVIRAFGVPGEDDLHAVHHHVRARRAVGVVAVENNDDLFAGIARVIGNQVDEPFSGLFDGQMLLSRGTFHAPMTL